MKASYSSKKKRSCEKFIVFLATLLHAAIDGDSTIDGERNCYR